VNGNNYPPGVTGFEPQIAGGDEDEREKRCWDCGATLGTDGGNECVDCGATFCDEDAADELYDGLCKWCRELDAEWPVQIPS